MRHRAFPAPLARSIRRAQHLLFRFFQLFDDRSNRRRLVFKLPDLNLSLQDGIAIVGVEACEDDAVARNIFAAQGNDGEFRRSSLISKAEVRLEASTTLSSKRVTRDVTSGLHLTRSKAQAMAPSGSDCN